MSDKVNSTVRIGDKEYAFKTVNLATFKKHLGFMKSMAQAAADQSAGRQADPAMAIDGLMEMAEIVYECVQRANLDVTLDAVLEGLDQETIGAAYGRVMMGSGYVPAGEPKPAGA